jgi:4-hydroxy-tetrahydrodipicolinate reductase
MGREIERLANEKGHEVVGRFNSNNPPQPDTLKNADVAIEFTRPELAPKHISICHEAGIPVVVGTTGWYSHLDEINKMFAANGALFTATNFSIGVNMTFFINKMLARMMQTADYAAGITEIHHTKKLDAPSGTAITLAEGIIESNIQFSSWKLSEENMQSFGPDLPVQAIRKDDVPGTHTVCWNNEIDSIEITHTAHNRKGFALGAITAAEWIIGKSGVYGMPDLLNFEALFSKTT